jgi:hypothetical protein
MTEKRSHYGGCQTTSRFAGTHNAEEARPRKWNTELTEELVKLHLEVGIGGISNDEGRVLQEGLIGFGVFGTTAGNHDIRTFTLYEHSDQVD